MEKKIIFEQITVNIWMLKMVIACFGDQQGKRKKNVLSISLIYGYDRVIWPFGTIIVSMLLTNYGTFCGRICLFSLFW